MPYFLKTQVSKPISRLARSGAIDAGDVAAALAIEAAVLSILTNGIRSGACEGAPPERIRSAGSFAEERSLRYLDERQAFYDWIDEMSHMGLAVGPVLDVIVEGKPLSGIDLAWRKRKGWTRCLVQRGLKVYRSLTSVGEFSHRRLTA